MKHDDRQIPQVTVIVAVRNMERTISQCVESLLQVDYPYRQIIVVDDGSTDSTAEIVSRYPVKIVRIKNSGVAEARNVGVNLSGGEIVAFTDGDCYVERDWLAQLVRRLDDETVGGVGGYVDFERSGIVATALSLEYKSRFIQRGRMTQSIACISAAFRKNVLISVGGFRRLAGQKVGGEDIDLSYRILSAGYRLAYEAKAIVHHDGFEMSRGIVKRNFRNAAVSVAIFREHRQAWTDPFFGRSVISQPIVFGFAVTAAAILVAVGWPPGLLLLVLPFLLGLPHGVRTAIEMRRLSAVAVVPAVLCVRSAAILAGAVWGTARVISQRRSANRTRAS